MTDIERCWITPGEFGGTKVLYDEADADAWRKAGFNVTGPWVIEAQQHRGAVAALEQIAAWDCDTFPEDSWRMVAAAREALGLSPDGGQ
jgi:hypothetical protein